MSETPRYKVTKLSYIGDQLRGPGTRSPEVEFDGLPNRHMLPLNKAAEKRVEEAEAARKQKRLARTQAQAAVVSAGGDAGNAAVMQLISDMKNEMATLRTQLEEYKAADGEEAGDEAVGSSGSDDKPKDERILDALDSFDPEDDAFWTKTDGLPDLNILKERLGEAVTRQEVEKAAPGFKRPSDEEEAA